MSTINRLTHTLKQPLHWLPLLLITGLLASLLISACFFQPKSHPNSTVTQVTDWSLQMDQNPSATPLTLPQSISAEHGAVLTLSSAIRYHSGDYLYLKTVYAPVRVYLDDVLIYQYGQKPTMPSFMPDPPTKVAMLPLTSGDGSSELHLEFTAPTQRNSISLHPVLIGTSTDIMKHLFSEMSFSLFFSAVLLVMGFILFLAAAAMIRLESMGISFFYLGLFGILTGLWFACECNLTGLFIDNAVLLYLLDFTGLFTLSIPLLKFGLKILQLHHQLPLRCTCMVLEISVCAALILQLTGTVAFSRSMYLFHILVPFSLCLFGALILLDAVKYKNKMARRFMIPISAVAFFSLLEVMNYYVFRTGIQITFFFQIGVLLFLVAASILCGFFMRDALAIKAKNHQLSYELALIERQMELQRTHYLTLSKAADEIRIHRHDFRHHLAVIREYNQNNDRDKLEQYLNELSDHIPSGKLRRFCENDAVNAIAIYYCDLARENHLPEPVIHLNIPQDTGNVPASDLCVVLGNLLDNAIHACLSLPEDSSFIRLQSRLQYDILTITLDNPYSFVDQRRDGSFRSTKSGGGTGLLSIQTIAERYGGNSEFKAENGVFSASVYLHLRGN